MITNLVYHGLKMSIIATILCSFFICSSRAFAGALPACGPEECPDKWVKSQETVQQTKQQTEMKEQKRLSEDEEARSARAEDSMYIMQHPVPKGGWKIDSKGRLIKPSRTINGFPEY